MYRAPEFSTLMSDRRDTSL